MSRRKSPIKITRNEAIRQNERKKLKFVREFPVRTIKFFSGLILFIPLTAIAFGAHCFMTNEWPWSDKI